MTCEVLFCENRVFDRATNRYFIRGYVANRWGLWQQFARLAIILRCAHSMNAE